MTIQWLLLCGLCLVCQACDRNWKSGTQIVAKTTRLKSSADSGSDRLVAVALGQWACRGQSHVAAPTRRDRAEGALSVCNMYCMYILYVGVLFHLVPGVHTLQYALWQGHPHRFSPGS